VLAPGKVNLCLLVGAPRPDGYHPLVSVVQPVDLADEVNLKGPGPFNLDQVVCEGVEGENLALRAIRAFREATGWDGPRVTIEITKRIPIAGGMGGGSSDAAIALRLLSEHSGLPIPPGLAMKLGADVPVLLSGTRALMTGAGEHVEPLAGEKPPLIVVPLDAQLSTPAVYRAYDEHFTPREDLEAAADRIRHGELEYVNDLEGPARRLCPAIDPALDALREAGVQHPMVSGSGPTVFGISDDPAALEAVRRKYPRAVRA
jgi:4-diphosphocytidyl-2-C-methyl-D-erythritol kinase